MLPKNLKRHLGVITTYSLLLGLSFALPAFAQQQQQSGAGDTPVTAQTMLQNIATQIPNLMLMVTAIAYVLGIYFVFFGILKLKQMGEQRTMMSSEHNIKGPLIYLTIGALLLYLPSSIQMGTSTFWGEPSPFSYIEASDQWGDFINDVYIIVQFIGVVAFIRGLVILSHMGGHGSQPGNFSKGLTHIIGGIFCINIGAFVQVIMVTLGIQT